MAETEVKLSSLEPCEILSKVYPNIEHIFKEYRLFGVSEEDFKMIALEEIDALKVLNLSNKSFIINLKRKIKVGCAERVRTVLSSSDGPKLLSDWLNTTVDREKEFDYKYAIKIFGDLHRILNNMDYEITPEIIIKLLDDNDIFRDLIKLIMNHYETDIKSGRMEYLFKNITLIAIVEVYCMVNDIEIEETNDEHLNNTPVGESVSLYLRDIENVANITDDKYDENGILIFDPYADRNELTKSALKYAVTIAKKYQGRGVALLDLIQYANLGLLRAAEKYDPDKGYSYTTYATWWIKQRIRRGKQDSGRNITLPVHIHDKLAKFYATQEQLSSELQREPTLEEIAERMNIKYEEALLLYESQFDTDSINSYVGDDEDTEFGDFIPDPNAENPEENVIKSVNLDLLKEAFACLKPREEKVIRLRYGLDDGRFKTLEEVGRLFDVTRERIRQIEAKALRKIKKYIERKSMDNREFLELCCGRKKENNGKKKKRREEPSGNKNLVNEEEKEMGGQVSLYTSLYKRGYDDREAIDWAIDNLQQKDKDFLYEITGGNYDRPKASRPLKQADSNRRQDIINKIIRLLNNKGKGKLANLTDEQKKERGYVLIGTPGTNTPKRQEELPNAEARNPENGAIERKPVIDPVSNPIEQGSAEFAGPSDAQVPMTVNVGGGYSIEDTPFYKALLEGIREFLLGDAQKLLSSCMPSTIDSIILALNIGCAGKCLSPKEIATILDLSIEKVEQTIEKYGKILVGEMLKNILAINPTGEAEESKGELTKKTGEGVNN